MSSSILLARLKRRAKRLAATSQLPLHAALDSVAQAEGHARWSVLAHRMSDPDPIDQLTRAAQPGAMMLIAARPQQGKTLVGLMLAMRAIEAGRHAAFFSLNSTSDDLVRLLKVLDTRPELAERLAFHGSDAVNDAFIMDQLASREAGTLAFIDHMQALDHDRSGPNLMEQLLALRAFARARAGTFVFSGQISASYQPSAGKLPGPADLRQPNPVDLSVFDTTCFLDRDFMRVETRARAPG